MSQPFQDSASRSGEGGSLVGVWTGAVMDGGERGDGAKLIPKLNYVPGCGAVDPGTPVDGTSYGRALTQLFPRFLGGANNQPRNHRSVYSFPSLGTEYGVPRDSAPGSHGVTGA